jgi:hypothetical protein
MEAHNLNKQKLSPQHKLELVDYIKGLSKRGLPPTREMTQRFASEIGNCHIGNGWVGRCQPGTFAHSVHYECCTHVTLNHVLT